MIRYWKYRNNRALGVFLIICILAALITWLFGCEQRITEKDELEMKILDNQKTIYNLESEIEDLKIELHNCKSEKEQLEQNNKDLEDRNTELEEYEEY